MNNSFNAPDDHGAGANAYLREPRNAERVVSGRSWVVSTVGSVAASDD